MDRRSLLGLWGRGDDCGDISGEDGADLGKNACRFNAILTVKSDLLDLSEVKNSPVHTLT